MPEGVSVNAKINPAAEEEAVAFKKKSFPLSHPLSMLTQ